MQENRTVKSQDFIRIQDILYLCIKWQWFIVSLLLSGGLAVFIC